MTLGNLRQARAQAQHRFTVRLFKHFEQLQSAITERIDQRGGEKAVRVGAKFARRRKYLPTFDPLAILGCMSMCDLMILPSLMIVADNI
jgi:hypothetical protein